MTKRGRPRKERYARLMGGCWRHPKIRRLSNETRGVLLMIWSYAADQATDGLVPVELIRAWAGKRYKPIIAELTRGSDEDGKRPLLVLDEEEIDARAHDWEDVNISVAEWERRLDSDRNRKRKGSDIPTGKPTGYQADIPPGKAPDFQPVALDEDEDEDDLGKDNTVAAEPPLPPPEASSAPAAPPLGDRLRALEARYPAELVAEARVGCALRRPSGKMADSVWVATLERLSKLPETAVVNAMRVFTDRYADGSKDEKYLVGIARREASDGGSLRRISGRLPPANGNTPEDRASNKAMAEDYPELFAGMEVANG